MTSKTDKGFSPLGELGILLAMTGGGLVAGGMASIALMSLNGIGVQEMQQATTNPANAPMLKLLQFLSTLFSFFVPALAFAFICHRQGWRILGFRRPVLFPVLAICIAIVLAAGPLIDALTQLNKAIPVGKSLRAYFDGLEAAYEAQIKVIGAVKTWPQYLMSIVLVAMMPALFEEVLFRGALQGILTRWFGHALAAVVVTGLLFSLVHFSWYGFLPRWVLGILLGLIYWRTGNLWYPIIVHFVNNAAIITYMFISSLQGKPVASSTETTFPWWAGIFSLVALFFLFTYLRNLVKRSTRDITVSD